MRIRVFIVLMVAAVMVPLVLASALAVNKIRQEENAAAIASLKKTVEAISLMVDRDIQSSVAALRALGNSEHLQTGNFEAFYAQAKAINTSPQTWTALFEADGTQVLSTNLPFLPRPVTLPMAALPGTVAKVHATQKLVVSDVFSSPVTGNQRIAVYVPSASAGAKSYVVAQGFALDHWKDIAKQHNVPPDWIVAVIDRAGRFIARSHKSDQLLGQPARPELVAAAAQKNDGLIRHSTLEGIESYDAFDHSEMTGWTIAVAAPVASVDAPVVRAVQIAVAGFMAALIVSGILATVLGRRLITALQSAGTAAVLLGQGKTPKAAETSILEVDALNQSLANAGELLERERQARQAAEVERERLLEVERLARDVAQKENTAKDHFLAMLGHELRNPLAAISGAVSVLTRGSKDTLDADRYLGIIRRQNRHLVHIIDDLLDMSRLIAGKIVLDPHPVDLAECLQSCVEGLRAAQRTTNHTLKVTALPAWVNADPVRIEQVLINLIGNALKYSPAGSIIMIDLHQADGIAVLRVQDQGTGLTPTLMAQVFEPFVQGPVPLNVSPSGLGIGLALVRQLMELHGGTVSVASAGAGQGSTFTCKFPVIAAPSSVPGSEFSPLMAARHRTLLYVEDNADALAVMSEMLRLSGYTVIEASCGLDAVTAVRLKLPDAVVLDLGLPDVNGYEVARLIRQLPNGHDLPIIALTGYANSPDEGSAAQFGFSAHLVKPVDPEELTRTLDALLAAKA